MKTRKCNSEVKMLTVSQAALFKCTTHPNSPQKAQSTIYEVSTSCLNEAVLRFDTSSIAGDIRCHGREMTPSKEEPKKLRMNTSFFKSLHPLVKIQSQGNFVSLFLKKVSRT